MADNEQAASSQTGYIVDAENAAEMARLTRQARYLTTEFGLLPTQLDLPEEISLLDLGCGPGEWALEAAPHFPKGQVVGVDISEMMLNYARYSSTQKGLANLRFQHMDARQPLTFPDASFDLIHMRFLVGFMTTPLWPHLLRECWRLLRPGGILCHIEPECVVVTTSPALARYSTMVVQAMRQMDQCFTPSGDLFGITIMQPRLLAQAGFEEIQQESFVLNCSAGTAGNRPFRENFTSFLKLLQPLLVHCELIEQKELDALYTETLESIEAEDFCGAGFFQRAWGRKPAEMSV
jgi:ubiquinone/menaquinone biosynthesis C-methylase UbiE